LFYLDGLVDYEPMKSGNVSTAGTPTLTGTAVRTGPTVVYPSAGSWTSSEVGNYFKGLTTQFDGLNTLKSWKTDLQSALTAGTPYPQGISPELKRLALMFMAENSLSLP
jgi:hypothetical protein